MAIDISLLAVPKEAERILTKAALQSDSEYGEAVFALPKALEDTFVDFGHPDWIALRKDAKELLQFYPKQQFDTKFYYDTNRTYEVFDYLFAKHKNAVRNFKDATPFFYDGIVHSTSISGQGFPLYYWDLEHTLAKKTLFESVSFERLFQHYNLTNMKEEGVYKMEQFEENFQELQQRFTQINQFLADAVALQGYVLVMKY
ncbi:MAG: DUF1877 family protein [Bacteroidota bacterium]